jgi:hypothetical protein
LASEYGFKCVVYHQRVAYHSSDKSAARLSMKSVIVTGVSTGIGWGCVKVLIESGFRVFGSVRKQADAERLTKEFGPNFTPLIFDVTDKAAVAKAAKEVEAALGGETLAGLVNNAGVAVLGPLMSLRIEEFEHQLAVNLTGPLIVTQAFKGLLGVDRSRRGAPGRIVMISSVGGKNAMPFLGPYCASKFGLEGMSESLRRELMGVRSRRDRRRAGHDRDADLEQGGRR